jgi:uncharacterized protein involved in outer membrane biogenesis
LKFLLSRRGAVSVCFLLLALLLIRPQAGHLRGKISDSIGRALGKHVEIGSVHLLFLPRPGFALENLAIRDDSAEPLLRSPEVTAWLRVSALMRGRIEISRLSLSDASLNLTRDPQGKWNLQDLLERTSRIPTGPRPYRESRTEFPYIEATRARINFKIGSEKTHFALTDARFAVWQQSDNVWGLRLRAQPIRTDANLTDAGLIDVNGIWQRSSALQKTPLQFSFQWNQAQIGQASKLVYGNDKGWRGNVIVTGTVAGTPEKLQITTDGSVDGFRRHDVLGGSNLRLAAHCTAQYASTQKMLSDLDCTGPAGAGSIEMKGGASWSPLAYNFSLVTTKLPAQSVLALLRRATENVPDDLIASGNIDSTVALTRSGVARQDQFDLRGDGEAQNVKLSSGRAGSEVSLGTIPFVLGSGSSKGQHKRTSTAGPELEIGPINFSLGRPGPLQARGSFSKAGYTASLHGEAEIKRLLQAAHMVGIPASALAAEGGSTVDLKVAGDWNKSQPLRALGSVQLRSVRAQVRGWNAPLQITSAYLILDQEFIKVQNVNASAAGATWRGSMQISRPCPVASACKFQFNLRSSAVSAAALNNLMNPRARKRSWYKFFSAGETQIPFLAQARATGAIAIDKLELGRSTCAHFTSNVELNAGKLTLKNVGGEMLNGSLSGQLKADFLAKPPTYQGTGNFDGVSLADVADLMHDGWIAGTGNANYKFTSAGWGLQELIDSADLSGSFSIENGGFPHVVLTTTSGPLRASDFSGSISFRDGKFRIADAKLTSSGGVYKVGGSASMDGSLNLKMSGEGATGYSLSGTLVKTRVSPVTNSATQAALKP